VDNTPTYVIWIWIVFGAFLAALLVWGLWKRWWCLRNRRAVPEAVRLAPGLAVSAGILGTFLGISIGLYFFEAKDFAENLPGLLEGMKTAFYTSVGGLSVSLILKISYGIFDDKQVDISPETSADPIVLLQQIQESNSRLSDVVLQCLSSDEEYSMLNQMKLIRQEVADTRKGLISAFEKCVEEIVSNSSKQLVEALEKVISDFNVLLGDLVGAAFDELRISIQQLNEWQKEHRQHLSQQMEQTTSLLTEMQSVSSRIEAATKSIESIDGPLDSIAKSVESLSLDSEQLEKAISTVVAQNERLETLLEQIEKTGEAAKKVLPSINQHLTAYTNGLRDSLEEQNQMTQETARMMKQSVQNTTNVLTELETKQQQQLDVQIKNLEQSLSENLEASMSSFVGAMTQLSNRFVQDYSPLTTQLREVVQIASRVQNEE